MLLVIKIVLSICLVICIATCAWIIIGEIKEYENWARLIVTLLLMILGALDFNILWFI
jgi:hypothetical protein